MVPGGSAYSAAGSSVSRPAASIAQAPGKRLPSRRSRFDMPLVVIEALMSTRIGSPSVGMPTATGSGVNTALRPPNGATLASAGSELAMVIIRPRAVAGRVGLARALGDRRRFIAIAARRGEQRPGVLHQLGRAIARPLRVGHRIPFL